MSRKLTPLQVAALMAAQFARVPEVEAEASRAVHPGPPDGWTEITPEVISNYDGAIDELVAEQLREGGRFARHAAWNFNGLVWFEQGRWHEVVCVYGQRRATYSDDTLDGLRRTANDNFGWE